MKKYLYLLSLLYLIISCKSYSDFLTIEDHFVLENRDALQNGQYIDLNVNGKLGTFLFDTGATSTIVSDVNLLGGKDVFTKDKYSGLTSMTLANGAKVNVGRFKTDSIMLGSVNSVNRKVILQDFDRDVGCDLAEVTEQGICGMDLFNNSEFPLVLDYENNVIYFSDTGIPLGFKEIPSKVKGKRIHVYLNIFGEQFKLLFDTGNTSGIILTKAPSKWNGVGLEYDTMSFMGDGSLTMMGTKMGEIEKTSLGDLPLKNVPFSISNGLKEDNMGLSFINRFNWIIDFENEKVYAKKIADKPFLDNQQSILDLKYAVVPIKGALNIALNTEKNQDYKVGNIITAVGDTKITSENICEYFELLNRNNDWDALDLTVLAPKE